MDIMGGGGGGGGAFQSLVVNKYQYVTLPLIKLKAWFTKRRRRSRKQEIPHKPCKTETEQNRIEREGLFSSVHSLFYRVCMGFRASVFVASVNQA